MERSEILIRYRWLILESETLSKQADKVMGIGIQADVRSTWPSKDKLKGLPGGTNDPETASAQRFDWYIKHLRDHAEELMDICGKFEETIALLVEDDARVICRMYYGIGMTDEAIGEKVHADQATVNRIRNKALASLDLA